LETTKKIKIVPIKGVKYFALLALIPVRIILLTKFKNSSKIICFLLVGVTFKLRVNVQAIKKVKTAQRVNEITAVISKLIP